MSTHKRSAQCGIAVADEAAFIGAGMCGGWVCRKEGRVGAHASYKAHYAADVRAYDAIQALITPRKGMIIGRIMRGSTRLDGVAMGCENFFLAL